MQRPDGARVASETRNSADPRVPVGAVGWAIAGFALYSFADAGMKLVAGTTPIAQAIAVSSAASLIPVALLAFLTGGARRALRIGSWPVHVARAGTAAGAMCCNVYAFAHMPLADAYAILFSGPLVQSAAAAILLGEALRWRDWAAILLGFCGVLVMLKPDLAGIDGAALSALAGVSFFSASSLIVRRFGGGETRLAFPFYGSLFICLLVSPVAIAGFTPPSADILLLNVAIGVLTGLAMTAVLAAFQMTAVARVAPFQYSQLVWAVLLGWLIFGDMPTPRLALGAALVIASGVLVLRRDRYAASRAQVESAASLANRHSSTEET